MVHINKIRQDNYNYYAPGTYGHSLYGDPPRKPSHGLLYLLLFFVVLSLGISTYSVISLRHLDGKLSMAPADNSPAGLTAGNAIGNNGVILDKLTDHEGLQGFKGMNPVGMVQIASGNLQQLQQQVGGLGTSNIGEFLVQFNDRIVLYNADKDIIEGQVSLQPQAQQATPQDFFVRLGSHPEAQPYLTANPVGGQIDIASLNALKQQFPEVYRDAKPGDYLLRFPTGLVIYDYFSDKVVNAVPLGQS